MRKVTATKKRRQGHLPTTERREALLDAALTVIRRDGPAASMDAMAAEAGITKPILYRHFGDRNGVLRALADRFAGEFVERLEATFARHDDPHRRLEAAVDAYLRFIEDDLALYTFLTQHTELGTPGLLAVVDHIAASVARAIGEALRDAGADSGAAEPWAYGIVGMVHLAGARWVASPTMPRKRLVEYLVALVWDGMARFSQRPTQ